MSTPCAGRLLALAVLCGAFALFSERNTFPFYDHPDEPGKVAQVVHHKKNFHHPLLMLTSTELARKAVLHGAAEDDPQRVVELGRLVVASFAAAAAALLALLAARLHGLAAAAAVGILVATQPLLYELAHYFKEDPVLLFGIAACAWASYGYAVRRDARSLALLGAAAGVAAAGKYVGAVLVPAAAIVAASAPGLPARERWKRTGTVVGVALVTWLALDYRIFRSPAGIVPESLVYELGKAFAGKHGLVRDVPHAFYLGVQRDYGGFAVPALATLWVAFAVARPRKVSVAEWLLAAVSLVLVAAISYTPKTSARYYLPVAVSLSFLAVAGAFHWAALASARRRSAAFVIAALLCLAAAWPQARDTVVLRRAFERDDRTELIAAVEALPPGSVVAQDQSVGLPEPERRWQDAGRAPLRHRVIGAKQAPDLGSIAELRAQGVTHLGLCRRTWEPYFDGAQTVRDARAVAERRAFYETALRRGRVVREWQPSRVTYLHPGLALVDITELE